jgi:hypothetical protein
MMLHNSRTICEQPSTTGLSETSTLPVYDAIDMHSSANMKSKKASDTGRKHRLRWPFNGIDSKSSSSDSNTDDTRTLSHTALKQGSSVSADTESEHVPQHKVKLERSRWTSTFTGNKKVCNCNFMNLQLYVATVCMCHNAACMHSTLHKYQHAV